MAKIILQPNEVFEHSHNEESFTKLLSGKATYEDSKQKIELPLNEAIKIAPMQSHKVKNIGTGECTIECWHGGVFKTT